MRGGLHGWVFGLEQELVVVGKAAKGPWAANCRKKPWDSLLELRACHLQRNGDGRKTTTTTSWKGYSMTRLKEKMPDKRRRRSASGA